MSGGEQGPSVAPFSYVLIPAEDSTPASLLQFSGTSDEELREGFRRYFAKFRYTEGARSEMREALLAKVDDKAKVAPEMIDKLAGDEGAFEIVPIVLPSRANKFTAISLYIDDRGRFKDLPLNSRASKIAQRDIRGDGFLLSNHDDPALDDWSRISTTLETYEKLLASPPCTQLNTSNQQQMMAAAHARDSDTVVVSEEDALAAMQLKEQGNAAVGEGKFEAAVALYSAASEKLRGRTDLLPESTKFEDARTAVLLNLAHCAIKLGRWELAAGAAAQALVFAPTNPKGWFRLTTAQVQMRDYEEAEKSVERCAQSGVPESDVSALRAAIASGKQELERQLRRKYAGMFS